MCDHKTESGRWPLALNAQDKRWLEKNKIQPYDCYKCEALVRMLPKPKLRVEEKKPEISHDDDEAQG